MLFSQLIAGNVYPGRGIMVGTLPDGRPMFAYFIMGRSQNSRNRIFEKTEDGIRTRAHDPAQLTDPSLIIYHPVRRVGGGVIVTNGDQTDTIADHIVNKGQTFEQALFTREYEPDGPNFTPRISAMLSQGGSYKLSILKSASGDGAPCARHFYNYEAPMQGKAHFISTYKHDGDPLPSFCGEPHLIDLPQSDAKTLAGDIWSALDEQNKISLYVCIDPLGDCDSVIINKHSEVSQ